MEIELFDLRRMLLGDLPWTFTFEIAVRTAVMYGYAFLLVRLSGTRTVGQLSLIELVLVIALGSAVGDPMFYPEVPLLHGLVVVTVVIGLNLTLNEVTGRSERVERLVEGRNPLRAARRHPRPGCAQARTRGA